VTNPVRLSIAEAGAAFRAGTLTATALAEAQLAVIAERNPAIIAFVAVTAEQAMTAAAQADADFAVGIDRGSMQGIGFAVKDIVDVRGVPTLCGSRHRPDVAATADAEVVARLRAQGAVPLGKVATYEYALVGPSFDGPHPPPVNPWNAAHITGGSSSGSAAAVAAGMVRCAIGTDTGGSIRSPACYCGVVGLKPTKGAVSTAGVFPVSDDLDHVGPLAASVADAAMMIGAMGVDAASRLGRPISCMKIGYARDWFAHDPATSPAVLVAMDQAMSDLSLLGAEVTLIDLPAYAGIEAVGIILLQYQALQVHSPTLNSGSYGRQAVETLMYGQNITRVEFEAARAEAKRWRTKIATILGHYDAVATANVLSTAPPFSDFAEDRAIWTAMRTLPFNMTGHPVLALPVGFDNGLPMGMQLVGRDHSEATLCQIGDAFERATDHSAQLPHLQRI
jgi:aspartyl-tRNA(Asn)/glutamyl-tRNA(Gln) amidotransferase subunit A